MTHRPRFSNTLLEVRVKSDASKRTQKFPLLLHPHRLSQISTISGGSSKRWQWDVEINGGSISQHHPLAAADTQEHGAKMEEQQVFNPPSNTVCSYRTFNNNLPKTYSTAGRPSSLHLSHHTPPPPATDPAAARPSSITSFRQILSMNRRPRARSVHERPRSLVLPSFNYNIPTKTSELKNGRNNLPNARFCVSSDQDEDEGFKSRHKVYPQLPTVMIKTSTRDAAAPSSAEAEDEEDLHIPLSDLRSPFAASQSTLSSIYSQETESSFTLELTDEQRQQQAALECPTARPYLRDLGCCSTAAELRPIHARFEAIHHSPVAPADSSRGRPLTQCFTGSDHDQKQKSKRISTTVYASLGKAFNPSLHLYPS
ncbi:hypothetical protein VP01_534g1 [Puccinia sorghi]|uniref:Uncharacterized protein n=1 Tax=Puccinia sorghi TaxID=27349 RepID=A0A0L6UK17_9BASI|nr:hypothetical protein VP01_534g1 [Puccinia sorghi]